MMLFLLVVQLLPIDILDFLWTKAQATTGQASMNLTYGTNSLAGYQVVFSNTATSSSDPITVTADPGKVIQEITVFRDGAKIQTIPQAVDQPNWTGSLTNFSGVKVDVKSTQNDNVKGYFAWYRYSPGGSQGLDWYQDGAQGCTPHSGANYTENVNGYMMPQYPGCTNGEVYMGATRTKGYMTTGTGFAAGVPIPSEVINVSSITATAVKEAGVDVIGPAGVPSGKMDATTRYDHLVPLSSDSFEVHYLQDFDHDSPYYKQLSLPGAKVMVYYAA